MNREKELAIKVMEFANKFTGWDFRIEQKGNLYLVGTTQYNQKGQDMTINYLIGEKEAKLMVSSQNCRYEEGYVRERIHTISQGWPVYVNGIGNNSLFINSPMPIEVLDSQIGTIVMKRMVDMIQAMTDILNFH